MVYDGAFEGGSIDPTGRVSYLQSYCGNCLNKLGYDDISSYQTCDLELGYTSMCVAGESPNWIHIIPSNINSFDGQPESVEENMAYIFITTELTDDDIHSSDFYKWYRDMVKWKE